MKSRTQQILIAALLGAGLFFAILNLFGWLVMGG